MSALALAGAPPATRPLRFLLTSPLWGVLAGLMLLLDPLVLGGRWAPPAVALVHVFTLGVLGNAMLGSLLQFLPVAAATPLAKIATFKGRFLWAASRRARGPIERNEKSPAKDHTSGTPAARAPRPIGRLPPRQVEASTHPKGGKPYRLESVVSPATKGGRCC